MACKICSRRIRSIALFRAVVDEPGAGIGRHAVPRPALRGDGERLLGGLLGTVEIAEEADQRGDDAPPFVPEDLLRQCSTSGRTSIAPSPRCRNARRECDRVVEIVGLEQVQPAEHLLRLGERPVGRQRLAVAHANRRRHVRRLQLVAAEDAGGLGEREVLLVDRRVLVVGPALPLGVAAVDEQCVLHASPPMDVCRRYDERAAAKSTRRVRKVRAPALSSISLRLPHFGLCTHDGQPEEQGQPRSIAAVSRNPALELLETALGDPDASGMAVVDEDGRPSRLRVDVRRQAADVPPVAHRPERQQARSARARLHAASREAPAASRGRGSWCGSGRNQIASVVNVVGSSSSGTSSMRSCELTVLRS